MVKTKNIYIVPVKKKDRKLIISDSSVHNGVLKYAIDFDIPIGTEIVAAYEGIVMQVKDDSKKGGFKNKYNNLKYLNFIIIKHKNNEYSEYSHLKYKGSLVKKEQKAKAGDVIGYSGNTGYTTAPHLHFHVCTKGSIQDVGKTLEVRFNEKLRILRK